LTLASQSAVDVLDESLLLFDQAVSGRESAAKAKMTEALAERAKGGENRQALLDDILKIVLDLGISDEAVGSRLREGVGLDRMRAAWSARQERLPRDHGHLAMLDASIGYLRQFAPEVLAAALDYLRPGDTLCVWKLDRLGRSVKDVLTIAEGLHEHGIGVRILTGTLAGSHHPTGEGKFFFTMMAAFSELERHMIHQRTMAGLAAARAQGRTGGRPTVMDPDKLAAARARQASGESPTQIAKALGVSRASVYRHLSIQDRPR
jgi:hypothetical protein